MDWDPDSIRKAKDVAQGELALALRRVLEDSGSATEDELSFRVARLFGWGRRGNDISLALARALRHLAESDDVSRLADGRYTVTKHSAS